MYISEQSLLVGHSSERVLYENPESWIFPFPLADEGHRMATAEAARLVDEEWSPASVSPQAGPFPQPPNPRACWPVLYSANIHGGRPRMPGPEADGGYTGHLFFPLHLSKLRWREKGKEGKMRGEKGGRGGRGAGDGQDDFPTHPGELTNQPLVRLPVANVPPLPVPCAVDAPLTPSLGSKLLLAQQDSPGLCSERQSHSWACRPRRRKEDVPRRDT